MRDQSIDAGRGILTILMVYCHVLQFFADTQLYPAAGFIIDGINLTVFQSFVFYFGATASLAYLKKTYHAAIPGMLKTCLRAYFAFVLSGVAYRVFRENKPFGPGTVRSVMQLKDIPGWSEFLIAFSGYALLLIILFPLFRLLAEKPAWAFGTGVLCFACTLLIPYSKVEPVQLALVIGGRQFACFPLLHYMPFLLAGMVYAQGVKRTRQRMGLLAAVLSVAGIVICVIGGGLPARFPPSWKWLMLGAGNTAIVVLAGKGLCMLACDGRSGIGRRVCGFFAHFGSRSLYYLLTSNVVIFVLAGKGIVPVLSRKSILPWTMPVQSVQGAACWTVLLFAVLWFVTVLAGRDGRGRMQK